MKLVYTASFVDVYEAIHWEKIVKPWRREKKQALINQEYEKLPELARTADTWMIYPWIKVSRFHVMLSLSKHMKAATTYERVSPFDKLRVTHCAHLRSE